MRKVTMFCLIGLLSLNLVFASTIQDKVKLGASETGLTVKRTEGSSFNFYSSLAGLKLMEVDTKSGGYIKLLAEGYVSTIDLGSPELPSLSKLVEIPIGSEIAIIVKSYTEEIIDLNSLGAGKKIFPAQPSLSKSQEPEDLEFYFNEEIYSLNEFVEHPVAVIDRLGTMRGVHLGRLRIHPVQYNPVTNQLRVLNNLEIEVHFYKADYATTKSEKNKYFSPIFNQNFAQVINYDSPSTKELIQVAPLKYVIVSDPMFEQILQPFIAWKTKKGFNVVEAYTNNSAVGNTTSTIKTYLQNEYTSATAQDPAPSYILFVGDVAQIPAFSGTTGSHVSDLYYCTYDGAGDIYPELYYGRFSATNTEQLQSQINKTLEYEQYLMPNSAFLDEVVMIAGVDAGMAPTYGNGQINYGTSNYFNMAHGLTSHTYLYGSGSPITSNSSGASAAIIGNISNGVGFANYTAHCGSTGWGDPSFSNSDISSLNNNHKYPLMIGNCCLSVKFEESECFGEAILRAENKGAMGYIGGSNSTYWDEDYWWGVGAGSISSNPTYAATGPGAYDGLFHENGEALTNWYVTNGQIVQAGNLAVTAANGAEDYYWEIYHLMGDPSVSTYMGVPSALSCTHYAAVPMGTTTLTVTTEEHAYVALSKDGVLLDAGIADATGTVLLEFDAIMMVGPAYIVATKQDRQPYISTVDIIVNNAPFVVYADHTIDDSQANNNGNADFMETVNLNVTLNNLGTVDASNVNAILSTTDTCISIVQNTALYGTIVASSNMALNTAFQISVAPYFEDQHTVPFTIDVTDGTDTWTSTLSITINSPKMEVGFVGFNDSIGGNNNHRFDAGEVIFMAHNVQNTGHVESQDAFSHLSSTSPYLEILTDSFAMGQMGPMMPVPVVSTLVIDPATPLTTVVDLNFDLVSGMYTGSNVQENKVGLVAEDWESNSFTSYSWENTSNIPWTVTSSELFEGSYAARSGAIGNSASTVLQISIDVAVADYVKFYKKVSCEEGGSFGMYDYLEFFIDGNSQDQWGGEVAWSQESYPLTVGTHTLKWVYKKDSYATGGSDCAWVDLIEFPLLNGSANNTAPEFTSTDNTEATKGSLYTYTLLTYDAEGDNVSINPVTIPGWLTFADNGNGTATLSGTPTGFDIYTHQVIISANDGVAYTPHIFGITVASIIGIEETSGGIDLSIYPNPSKGFTTINYQLTKQEIVSLRIYNSLGELISSPLDAKVQSSGVYSIDMDMKEYDSGIYYCRFATATQISTHKIIITK